MTLLTGELPPQRGTVSRPKKLGVLRHDQFAFDARPFIKFTMNRASGKLAIKFTDISKAYPGNEVIDGFSGIINRGEKIVLIGRNGSGKTTMLKALLSEPPDSPNDQVGG